MAVVTDWPLLIDPPLDLIFPFHLIPTYGLEEGAVQLTYMEKLICIGTS